MGGVPATKDSKTPFLLLQLWIIVTLWIINLDRLGLFIMDSDHSSSSSSSAAAKLRYCGCGKRMSTLTYDFHSSCICCCGIDCDFDSRCEECANIDDDAMTVYIRHRRSLLSKQRSKSKRKDPLC